MSETNNLTGEGIFIMIRSVFKRGAYHDRECEYASCDLRTVADELAEAFTRKNAELANVTEERDTAQSRIAELEALLERAATLCYRCRGKGRYELRCLRCERDSDDHDCPSEQDCLDATCIALRAKLERRLAEKGGER